MRRLPRSTLIFFFNDTATTEIYTLSLHDALPISIPTTAPRTMLPGPPTSNPPPATTTAVNTASAAVTPTRSHRSCDMFCSRSEEHTSELQSRQYLVCRLLLEKKKTTRT